MHYDGIFGLMSDNASGIWIGRQNLLSLLGAY